MLYLLVIMIKPSLIYNKDGSLREFGIGQSKKTIMPIRLISILAGILSYLIVLYVQHIQNYNIKKFNYKKKWIILFIILLDM